MAKIPTTASSPAAVVTGIPWSCADGMKCGCTSPLVDAPQIMKLTASTQNTRVRAASASPRSAVRAAPERTGSTSSAAVPPYGTAPTSRGRSRSSHAPSGATAARGGGGGGGGAPPPAPAAVGPGDQRQEHQLPGSPARGEDARHEA